MNQLLIIGGIALLYGGGELLVRYAAAMGRVLGMSTLLVGLTIVSFGTSAPELASTLSAALRGSQEMAIANVIGSNIANVAIVIGLVVLLKPVISSRHLIRVDLPVMLGFSLLFVLFCLGGSISRLEAAVLLGSLFGYLVFSFRMNTKETETTDAGTENANLPLWKGTTGVLFGLVCLALGAEWLVEGAVHIARDFGIAERVIGLTLVALGTSLPELATSFVAAYRGEHDLLLGNVVGSNVFNLLAVAGITGLVSPMSFSWNVVVWDLSWMCGLSALLFVMLCLNLRLDRAQGVLLFGLYVIYLISL